MYLQGAEFFAIAIMRQRFRSLIWQVPVFPK
jgi:hypothetical protein